MRLCLVGSGEPDMTIAVDTGTSHRCNASSKSDARKMPNRPAILNQTSLAPGRIQVVQVEECPASSDHPVRGELVSDSCIPGVIELAGKWRNHGLVRLLDPARHGCRRPMRG